MSIDRKVKNAIKKAIQNVDVRFKNVTGEDKHCNNEIVVLNTAIGTKNLGDEIIVYYYSKALKGIIELDELYNISTHIKPSDEDIERLLKCKYAVIIGTNILSPRMEVSSGWKFDNRLIKMRNVILIGAGWQGYKKASIYSKYVYRNILSKQAIHSVRDEQAYQMLQSIGINNVINTNCLTMIGLDKSCNRIPSKKADRVVFTLNYTPKDIKRIENDKKLIRILRGNYKKLFFFPQGPWDLDYLEKITTTDDITIIEESLKAYTEFLENNDNVDYVGLRLHGGIHAMQNGKRSIIIGLDNRAVAIARDTGLPMVLDSQIDEKLEEMISTEWPTKIHLNTKGFEAWRENFSEIVSQ